MQINKWHYIKKSIESGPKEIIAEATLEPDSLWFDGHFPGFPLLPGIAELAIVSDVLKADAERRGKTITISAIRKVRFRQFVRPNDTLKIVSIPDERDPGVYKFKLLINDQIACNGVMATIENKS